jgi:transcriptional regulator with XRE-family HTH domain
MAESRTGRLGPLLRNRRLELGLRLEAVAEQAGVDPAGLSRTENSKKNPQPETLALLAPVLNLPLADLYEAAGYPLPQQLPTLRPYLRKAYGVSDQAADEIEAYLEKIAAQYGGSSGPALGEDEY